VLGAANPAVGPFLSRFSMAIPISMTISIWRDLGIGIEVDFLLLNTVQLESLDIPRQT
jgi:hypothetical protein